MTVKTHVDRQVKERPVLFNAEMVKAILDGRKTQTRRAIKPQPPASANAMIENSRRGNIWWAGKSTAATPPKVLSGAVSEFTCTENVSLGQEWKCPFGVPGDRLWVRETWMTRDNGRHVLYRANFDPVEAAGISGMYGGWKPSIHMLRKHSRITLEITGVRVERVQDISDEDALAEGSVRGLFETLWARTYGVDAWNKNPWVWVVEFKRL